jgi:propanediol utilization protein
MSASAENSEMSEKSESAAIPVAITARHVRLSQAHLEALFGRDHELQCLVELTQPGEFAAAEHVTVRGAAGSLEGVRVVGPVVDRTRVELSVRDDGAIGLGGVVRLSSSLDGSPGCTLEGPAGTIVLAQGVLNAMRHLRVSPDGAKAAGIEDGATVEVAIGGERARIFRDVLVRVEPGVHTELVLDVDAAASVDTNAETMATLVGADG